MNSLGRLGRLKGPGLSLVLGIGLQVEVRGKLVQESGMFKARGGGYPFLDLMDR
jgi:hypothetical protein